MDSPLVISASCSISNKSAFSLNAIGMIRMPLAAAPVASSSRSHFPRSISRSTAPVSTAPSDTNTMVFAASARALVFNSKIARSMAAGLSVNRPR